MRYSPFRIMREVGNVFQAWRSMYLGGTHSRPISVNILVTDRCNSQCITCDMWKNDIKKKDFLDIEHFEKLSNEFKKMGVLRIAIGGGEPLLRKDIVDIIRIFSNKGIDVQMTSHGLLCDAKMVESLWQAGLKTLTISLDGHTVELYKEIRGVDWFARVLANIKSAIANKPRDCQIETNTVILSKNVDQVIDILKFAIDLGVDGVNVSPIGVSPENNLLVSSKENLFPDLMKAANVVNQLIVLKKKYKQVRPSYEFINGMKGYFSHPNVMSFDCNAGYVSVDVYENGDVKGCGSIPVVGNILKSSFQEVWKSADAQKQRIDMRQGKCPGCYVSCKIEPALFLNPKHTLPMGLERIRQ